MRLHLRRRSLAGALVLLAGSALALTAGPASSAAGFQFVRHAGADRYGTAATIARAAFASADNVVLASGAPRSFPDALTGNYLAGIGQGPVLLTTPGALPQVTREALRALQAKRVFVIGGPAAVSSAVEADLRGSGYTVERLGGGDRYATAELVVKRVASVPTNLGTIAGERTAILGSGQDFPDILAGGPLSWSQRFPLTITRPDALPSDTRDVLVDLQIRHVVIVGGARAVSAAVETEVRGLGVATVTRLAGADRAETAVRIAEFAYSSLGYDAAHVDLARSDGFADALAAGPHAGRERSPILLTTPTALSPVTRDLLAARSAALTSGHVFGGDVAVSSAVVTAAVVAGTGTAPVPEPTARPTPSPSPTPTIPPEPPPTTPPTTPPPTTPPPEPVPTTPPPEPPPVEEPPPPTDPVVLRIATSSFHDSRIP